MRSLDEFVDDWVRNVGAAEPHLVPHLDEIADHLRSDARERMRAGHDVPSAFAAATEALGAPRAMALDFEASEARSERRLAARFAVTTIAATFFVTAAFVAVDKLVTPLDGRWFVLLYLPVLGAAPYYFFAGFVRRARARTDGVGRSRRT